jgi:hypothetical protein
MIQGNVTNRNAEEVARRVEILLSAKTQFPATRSTVALQRGSDRSKERIVIAWQSSVGLSRERSENYLANFSTPTSKNALTYPQGMLDTDIKARRNLTDHFGREHRLEAITKADARKLSKRQRRNRPDQCPKEHQRPWK